MPIIMPEGANIPPEWQTGSDGDRLCIVVPSWSQTDKTSYLVIMNTRTRELTCECKGFEYRGDCHHVRGLRWFCKMPRKRKGVSKTSLEAFRMLTQEDLSNRQEKVLKAIEELGPISDKQIGMVLGWPINCVTPRRGELEDMGVIRNVGEQFDDHSRRHEMTWSVA